MFANLVDAKLCSVCGDAKVSGAFAADQRDISLCSGKKDNGNRPRVENTRKCIECSSRENAMESQRRLVSMDEHQDVADIVQGMRTDAANAVVQASACRELLQLVATHGKRVSISTAGGIECIVGAMATHLANADVQTMACGALANLAANETTVVGIAAARGIPSIVAAMAAHPA